MLPIEFEVTGSSTWTGGPVNIPGYWPVLREPKPHTCPVCLGSGQYETPPINGGSSTVGQTHICHGCGGQGWVTV